MQSSLFLQIVKRMQAFGVLSLRIDDTKIADNTHLQLLIYKDELVSAFKKMDFVKKVAVHLHPLKELFGSALFDDEAADVEMQSDGSPESQLKNNKAGQEAGFK